MLSQNLQSLRSKILTMVAINVFQPVEKTFLIEQLQIEVNTDQIDHILDELIKEQRVALEKDHYRLTYKGIKSIVPGRGRILRDIQRMEYLTQLSSKGGGM